MGVNCSIKAKNRRQSIIKFKVETTSMEKPFDTVFISDSMFFNILIKKMFNDYLKEDELNKKFEIVLLNDSLNIQSHNNIYEQLIDSNKLNSSLNKEMKILYDFKTLILLKQREKPLINDKMIVQFIQFMQNANVNLKRILILESPLEKFLEKFALFNKDSALLRKNNFLFPLILFDFTDLILTFEKPSKLQKSIFFVENSENFSKNSEKVLCYFEMLKIHSIIIFDDEQKKYNLIEIGKNFTTVFCESAHVASQKKVKELLKKEISLDSAVLFIYDKKKYQEFLDFLIDFLCKMFKCFQEPLINYFLKLFPEQNINNNQINIEKKLIKKKSTSQNLENKTKNRCEEMTILLEEIKKTIKNMNSLVEIVQKLITNIINEPNNEKFRMIKSTNEKLKKTIFSSQESRKLLELCGFFKTKDGADLYKNTLDIMNLKIIKSDFDLAARNFLFKKM